MRTSERSLSTFEGRGKQGLTPTRLSSLAPGYRALVFGASGGIGGAFVSALAADPSCRRVYAASRSPSAVGGKVEALTFDLIEEDSIAAAIEEAASGGPLDIILVATGVLHDEQMRPEKSARAISSAALECAFRINTVGPALIAKHALPKLRKDKKAMFAVLSARVGSISDNRLGGWHSYRASKAALNMLVRNFAIQLARSHPLALCVSLHPGTVDTALSKPFQGGLTATKLKSTTESAAALLSVLDNTDSSRTGSLIAWNGDMLDY